jgi:hypothetical protein
MNVPPLPKGVQYGNRPANHPGVIKPPLVPQPSQPLFVQGRSLTTEEVARLKDSEKLKPLSSKEIEHQKINELVKHLIACREEIPDSLPPEVQEAWKQRITELGTIFLSEFFGVEFHGGF